MVRLERAFRLMLVGLALVAALANPASAQLDFDTSAPYAILVDYESGTVLFQKEEIGRAHV